MARLKASPLSVRNLLIAGSMLIQSVLRQVVGADFFGTPEAASLLAATGLLGLVLFLENPCLIATRSFFLIL